MWSGNVMVPFLKHFLYNEKGYLYYKYGWLLMTLFIFLCFSFVLPLACPVDCIMPSSCNVDKNKGLWVDVKYLQLGAVDIPNRVMDRWIEKLIEREERARQDFVQESQVIRKKTFAEVCFC